MDKNEQKVKYRDASKRLKNINIIIDLVKKELDEVHASLKGTGYQAVQPNIDELAKIQLNLSQNAHTLKDWAIPYMTD